MTINIIEDQLRRIVKRNIKFRLEENEADELLNRTECDLINDFGFDSFSLIKLISDVENMFEIDFSIEDMNFETIRNYANLKELILKYKK